MALYSLKQKIFIVKKFYQNGNSVEIVKNEFPCEFKKTKLPTDSVIVELVNLFEEFGSVLTKHVENKRNSQSSRSIENADEINVIKCEDNETKKWDLFTGNDIVEIKTEPEILYTDKEDPSFHKGVENRFQRSVTIDHALDDKKSSPYKWNKDTDTEESELLNEFRSQNISRKSILNSEIVEFKDIKDEYCNNNELDSRIHKIDDKNVECNKIINKVEVFDKQKIELESKTEENGKNLQSNKSFNCEECNKEFNRKRDYLRHINNHGKSCKICGVKYRDYHKHMIKHTGEKLYQCNECEAQFVDKTRLKGHMITHSTVCPFECDLCKKTFKSRDYLRRHNKTHLKERPYKCDICGKGFLHNNDLANHNRTHTGEKPYVCSFCGKCFATHNALIVHNRIHTGEVPYKCSLCDKQFNAFATLKMHKRRIHTGEKPYKCKFCEKAFCDSSTRKVHERIHTGDYPFKCLLCGKGHNHPSNVKSHMRHVHSEQQ